MGEFADYLARLGEKVIDDEAAERWERDQAEMRLREERDFRARQMAKLSARHVADAQRVISGEITKSGTWKVLAKALSEHRGGSILLVGPTGTGKTTASTGYAVTAIGRGMSVQRLAASRLQVVAKHEEAFEEAELVDLLIVDELHRAALLPGWVLTSLVGLIDARYERKRQTIGLLTAPDSKADGIIGQEVVDRFDAVVVATGISMRRE